MNNCVIKAPEFNGDSNASKMLSRLMCAISAECGNWSKNGRKKKARQAVALGLVCDVREFYKMFPRVKEPTLPPPIRRVPPPQPANRDEIIRKWQRWCQRYTDMNNIIPEVLEKVDLNQCLSGKGNISNPKILNEYLKFYNELNKQCRETWIKWCKTTFRKYIYWDKTILNKIDFTPMASCTYRYVNWEIWEKYNDLRSQKKKSEWRHQYGIHSQITRKEWGSAYKPARG